MRKWTLILSVLFGSMTMMAEVYTLNLDQPTNPASFQFNENGMWTETWSEDPTYSYIESQLFGFSHLLSGNSYGGMAWDGFTVSKAMKGDYYANVAQGGIRGKGSPFILAYYNEWWLMDPKNADATSSNQIIFNDGKEYYPRFVYLNNVLVSRHDILNGNAFGGRAFKKGDKFGVKIEGLDDEFYPDGSEVTYLLADYTSDNEEEWFVNTEWTKVDLSSLGQVYGLQFTVFSTDQGASGTNTATYFALDGLTVSTTADEVIPEPLKVATFENAKGGVNVAKADTCWQGADAPEAADIYYAWKSGDFTFHTFAANWGGYSLVTVTNQTANTSTGMKEPYRSAKGGAYEGENFAVVYVDPFTPDTVTFDPQVVKGFFVNNNAYAVTSMSNGDSYAKRFGKDDWFKLTITGQKNKVAGNKVDFYLAQNGSYVNEWTYVDLSSLGEIDGITFSMSSSDNGDWGMNTPSYFAMDNFGMAKPAGYVEPARAKFDLIGGFENEIGGINVAHADTCWQGNDSPVAGKTYAWFSGEYKFRTVAASWGGFQAFTVTNDKGTEFANYSTDAYRSASGGAFEGENFAVWNMVSTLFDVTFEAREARGFYLNNTAAAVTSMCNGDGFAKKFGKDDWFKLTITGSLDGLITGTVDFYLAKDGKYVNKWTYVDLSSLGEIDAVKFELSSSDNGDWGMNTPSYFAMDNFGVAKPANYEEPERAEFALDPTAIMNSGSDAKAMKVLQNGQVIIIRDGKAFNVLGAQL